MKTYVLSHALQLLNDEEFAVLAFMALSRKA